MLGLGPCAPLVGMSKGPMEPQARERAVSWGPPGARMGPAIHSAWLDGSVVGVGQR